jgi:uncharacterized protein (DUF885 family)
MRYLTLLFCLASVAILRAQTDYEDRIKSIVESGKGDDVILLALYDIQYHHLMREFPEWALYAGYQRKYDRWIDDSFEAFERRRRELRTFVNAVETVKRNNLSEENKLNLDLLLHSLYDYLESQKFPSEYLPINQLGGLQQDMPNFLEFHPRKTVADFEDMLKLLDSIPQRVYNALAWMRKGLSNGITQPKITMGEVPQQISNLIDLKDEDSPLLVPFAEKPNWMNADTMQRLRSQALSIYRTKAKPAFEQLRDFMAKEYIPKCRNDIALRSLPKGNEWYLHLVKHHTTTTLTPDEIFDIGMSEVNRIRAKMDSIRISVGYKGTLFEFLNFMRSDPQFFYTDSASLIHGYMVISKRADAELLKLFRKLPRTPYGVVPVPAYAQKSQTTAYYNQGSLNLGRPGLFFANTYDLPSRPKWEMEALTLHEAVPGHHLQIALAQELENVPELRKEEGYTAYVEGWGLYAESLGEEMGFYRDAYSKMGQLTYEMWRSVRLVVDVGMHWKAWPRDKAIEFFEQNAGKASHDIEVEVDRYIVWPGQALAYKIGERKIKELRQYAESELGKSFDIRTFHDIVLGAGALPLQLLEKRIMQWVKETKVQ